MAWTTPRTWTTSETVTAAMLNTNLRDNLNYLFDQPMAQVSKTGNTTVTTGTLTAITTAVTLISTAGVTAGSAKLTPTVSGVFEGWFQAAWAGSASGHRAIFLNLSASTSQIISADTRNAVATGVGIFQSCSGMTPIMNGSTDNVYINVWQDSSGNQTLEGTSSTEPITVLAYQSPVFGIKMLGTGT